METILLQPGDPEEIFGARKTNVIPVISLLKDNLKNLMAINPEQCIEFISFGYGIRPQVSADIAAATKIPDRPLISELTCVKCSDFSSVKLYEYCLRAKTLGPGKNRPSTLFIISHSEEQVTGVMQYVLRDLQITSLSVQSTSEGMAIEQLSLSFSEYLWIWYDIDANGNVTGQNRSGWSVTLGKPIMAFTE